MSNLSRRLLGASAIATLSAAVIVGCAQRKDWTEWDDEVPRPQYDSSTFAEANSGCISCHEGAEDPHFTNEMGCVDCHGGNGRAEEKEEAHPQATFPEKWPEGGANPEQSYALLNEENLDWVRFVNPGDLRVANQVCGGCHADISLHVSKSIMTNASHFWGVAPYVNGILPNKSSILGESYSPEGVAQRVNTVPAPTADELARGVIASIFPLPQWEVGQTGNIFRVFEKGSRLGGAALGLNGNPVPIIGLPDKFEDPGRPNNRLSDRGLGTLNRVDLPLLNIFKTRLNDPFLSFLGTNDQPGDYRSSGCTACHMVYANDRDPIASGPYAKYGNRGHGNVSEDPWGDAVSAIGDVPSDEPGHPIMHEFTRAIPSSQCMVCHHHQPNSFVNSYLGYTMWAYETDGEGMFPQEEAKPTASEKFEVLSSNPEGAAARGNWSDEEFLASVAESNAERDHTQFADYHGHGWIFRGAYKMDRKGNLLDADGNVIPYEETTKFAGTRPKLGGEDYDPKSFKQDPAGAVHLMDIHAEKGMHCVDCHFSQDSHGDGKLYAEYQAAVEIRCQDCHGTTDAIATLTSSGPASASAEGGNGHPLNGVAGTPWGKDRFELRDGQVIQRSMLYPDLEWVVSQVKDTVDPGHQDYNPKAYHAKLEQKSTHRKDADGNPLPAHSTEAMNCYSCHTSWVTACFGCHLPQEANWKTKSHHYEDKTLRNYSTYNPQVVRDSEFMLGVSGNVKGNTVAPVRSSSALVISSQDALRQKIYAQVPTIAANGMSSQVFNTHFPHTVRKTETRACGDCHVSDQGDNNAWLAQTYLLGTNTVNFMGYRLFVGEMGEGFNAVRVTEWDEPQAVLGSNLHRLAYPERYEQHVKAKRRLDDAEHHGGMVRSLQLRGEYLYTAAGPEGFRVYDVANVNNKGFSEKIVTSPVSPLGQDTAIETRFATAVALPTNNHITMSRKWRPENQERPYEYRGETQNMHESYRYTYVSDRYEGLIIVDTDCLTDFDPQNNFIERKVTFNPDGILDGAENLTVCGTVVYVCCDAGIVAVDIDDPLEPRVLAKLGAPIQGPTSISVQFRYAFVTDLQGLKVIDVTDPSEMKLVESASLRIPDAYDVYVAKTYAYVSAGPNGLVIVDVERPEAPRIDQEFTGDGVLDDLRQTKVAMTNDSVFAYLANGRGGVYVAQLITPEDGGRSAFGFSPRPRPQIIAHFETDGPAVALSKGLDRDRAVDESGNQMAVFGRIGGRPLDLEERERFYKNADGELYTVREYEGEGSPSARAGGGGGATGGVSASAKSPR